jgi:hypothetical protein
MMAGGVYDMREISSSPGMALICSSCSVLDTGVGIALCKVQQSLGTLGHVLLCIMNFTNYKEYYYYKLYLFSIVALKSLHCSMLCS